MFGLSKFCATPQKVKLGAYESDFQNYLKFLT